MPTSGSRNAAPERLERVVDGRRLEVVRWHLPHSSGPTIVMLHEGLGSVAQWRDFPQRLVDRTGCAVVAYSRYGHGGSEPLDSARDIDYMHHEGEHVLPALLAELGLTQPILFGHSDGASVALIFAGTHPEAAQALILEAPHVFVEDVTVESIAKARAAFASTDLPARLSRYHADAERTFWGWNDIWLDPRFRSWNIESYLAAIRVPVLLVQGERDRYGTRAQLDAIASRTDARIVMFGGCGHSPHRDRPAETLDAVATFVEQLN